MIAVAMMYHKASGTLEVVYNSIQESFPNCKKPLIDYPIGTTGDNLTTLMGFIIDDEDYELDGYTVRVEFGINVIGSDNHAYKPFIVLGTLGGETSENVTLDEWHDEKTDRRMDMYYFELSGTILSNVKCSILPVQLAFSKREEDDSEDTEKGTLQPIGGDESDDGHHTVEYQFYSVNTLKLAVNNAIDATQDIGKDLNPKVKDAIYDVRYDEETNTFVFYQIGGNTIEITPDGGGGKGYYEVLDFTEEDTLTVPLNLEYTSDSDKIWAENIIVHFRDNDGSLILPYTIKEINGALNIDVTCLIPETVIMEYTMIKSGYSNDSDDDGTIAEEH